MSRSYTLDAEQARAAGVSNRITETGKYVGKFTRAEEVVSRSKTEGVEFTFESNDGRTADFLTCWTYNEAGDALYGLKVLNAVLTCLRVKQITPSKMQIQGRDGVRQANGFPDLMGKPIGLLLQREDYIKTDGLATFKFNIALPFEASSELTAGEILSKATSPVGLAKATAALRDKAPRAAAPRTNTTYASTSHAANGGGAGLADIDDDIPF